MSAYIKYKIKNNIWIMVMMTLVSILFFIELAVPGEASATMVNSTFFINVVIEKEKNVLIVILAFILGFRVMNGCNSTAETLLPLKRRTRYIASVIMGILFIGIQWLICTAAVLVHYFTHIENYRETNLLSDYYDEIVKIDSLGSGLTIINMLFLINTSVFLISGFCAIVVKNRETGIVLLGELIMMPYFFSYAVNNMGHKIQGKDFMNLDFLKKYFGLMYEKGMYFEHPYVYSGTEIWWISDVKEKLFGMIIISAVFLLLLVAVACICDGTSGKLMKSVIMDKLFLVISAIYVGFIVPNLFINTKINMTKNLYLVMIFLSAVIFYIAAAKMIFSSKKYDYLNKQ